MKKRIVFFCVALVCALCVLFGIGCAFKSPSEWQVAIGTVLFTAFQEGATHFALEELQKLHTDEVITEDEFIRLRQLILNHSNGFEPKIRSDPLE